MNYRWLTKAVVLCLGITGLAQSAINLHSIYSRAVKDGYSMNTTLDSLLVKTEVNSGVAISRYTMVLTPGTVMTSAVVTTKDTVSASVVRSLDSIEITMGFQLPSDFVADSMWLWINGKPVPAYIQDRALASQQYSQIVGTRKDPAILETSGNGYYNLRIFPASSLKSRKIEIEFRHLFDDGALYGKKGLVAAVIPLNYDSTLIYDYSTRLNSARKIGMMQASFVSGDYRTYSVSIPGLGEGTFSTTKELVLSAKEIKDLDTGVITSEDPSGADEFLWAARDAKSELITEGLSFDFSVDNLKFDPEPDTRIVAIDMRDSIWNWNDYYNKQAAGYGSTGNYTTYQVYNTWQRAQKYAVLALQQYLKEGQKFNLIIGGKSVTPVFPTPVAATESNIAQAITALLSAAPSPASSTLEVLKVAAEQAPKGIVILLSDAFQPAQYQILTDKTNRTYSVSDAGKSWDESLVALNKLVNSSMITLFTVADAYQISQLALQSGGFQLGGLLNRYNVQYKYEVIDGERISLPQLPPLFGSSNGSGIRNLSVVAEGLEDIAITNDNSYARYYAVGGRSTTSFIETDAVMAKTAVAIAPDYYYTNGIRAGRMQIAGRTTIDNSGKPVKVIISGKLDGLWFNRTITATGSYLPVTSSYRPFIDPQWAYRTSEELAFKDYVGNAALIKAIGKAYHMVTRQTSLLALEEGMRLWEDTLWQQAEAKGGTTNGVTPSAREASVADQAVMATAGGASTNAVGSGLDFDGFALGDIIKNNRMAVTGSVAQQHRSFSVVTRGSRIAITVPNVKTDAVVTMSVFDLAGRLVMQRSVSGQEFIAGPFFLSTSGSAKRLGHGTYSLQVSSGSIKKNFRITLLGN